MKRFLLALLPAVPALGLGATIAEEDFSQSSLTQTIFSGSTEAPASISLDAGRLRLETDVSLPTFGRAFASLDGNSIPNYPRVLGDAAGAVTWTIDLEYSDGSLNGSYVIDLALSEPNGISLTSFGYALVGGGQVGNEITLGRFKNGLLESRVIVSPVGPAPGEPVQLVVELQPSTGEWSLSSRFLGIGSGTLLPAVELGTGTDSTFLGEQLPFFHLGATATATVLIDNFRLDVVPEPQSVALLASGLLLLGGRRARQR